MPLIPASFLAGALLSLLLPVALLISLAVWHVLFIKRVPETAEAEKPGLATPAHTAAGVAPPEPDGPPAR